MNFISRAALSLFLRFTIWKSYSILHIINMYRLLLGRMTGKFRSKLHASDLDSHSNFVDQWSEISSKVYFSTHMGRSWKRLCGSTGKPSNMTLALASQPHPNGHQHTIRQGSAKQARKQIQLGICWTEAFFCEKLLIFLNILRLWTEAWIFPLLNSIKDIIVGEDGA